MDVDIDLDDLDFGDKIKDFLEHKLNEIKSNNASLQLKINDRKEHLNNLLETENVIEDTSKYFISLGWKKCFNNKYVLCYYIQNKSSKPLKNIKPLLKWSSSKHLTYETNIYSESENLECTRDACQILTDNLTKSTCVNSNAYILIVINAPNYLEILEYSVTGKIFGKYGSKEILIDLPNVGISSEDITNREVTELSLSSGNIENILAAIVTSHKTELVLIFPTDWGIPLDSTFEIHCSLTKINTPHCCKKYIMANRLSQTIDNTIIAIHDSETGLTAWTTVFSSSNDSLFSILHHLHQHIPGLIIIPKDLYEQYEVKKITNESTSDVLQQFQKSTGKELELIETFTQSEAHRNIRNFRSKLTDLEKETDLLYLKICELNKFNIISY